MLLGPRYHSFPFGFPGKIFYGALLILHSRSTSLSGREGSAEPRVNSVGWPWFSLYSALAVPPIEPYGALWSPTQTYGAPWRSTTEPFGALLCFMEPYGALQNPNRRPTELYRALFEALQNPTELYRTLKNSMEPYGALWSLIYNSPLWSYDPRCGPYDPFQGLGSRIWPSVSPGHRSKC
jgi:hypothetical protein